MNPHGPRPFHPQVLVLLLAPLLLVTGCKKDASPDALSVQTDLGTATAADPLDWPGVAVIPNLDDDDGDGQADFDQALAGDDAGDDDVAEISLTAPGGAVIRLSGGQGVRVWYDGGIVLSNDGDDITIKPWADPLAFQVEVGEYRSTSTLSFTDSATGDVLELPITGAPLVLNHHAQPSELTMAVRFSGAGYNNTAMIDLYEELLGDAFLRVGGMTYGDPWIQDEIEFSTATDPSRRLDLVVDSIRDGQYGPGYGLDDFPENEFQGPGWGVRTWGNGSRAVSQDYFGNMEVGPPTTVDGVDYPYGRIYYGHNGSLQPTADLLEMLNDQALQAPFSLDVSWLCVGHVDEFVTTVPAPGSRLGWKLVYSDVDLAWDIIDGMDPAIELPRYQATQYKSWDTIGDLAADDALRSLNEELRVDYLEPNLEIMKTELGLTDEDVIMIPGLFEEVSGCGGTTAAAFPGMANLIVADQPDGTPTLFVADPYLRADETDVTTDPIAMAMADAMPEELDVVFMDDWQVYHLNLGEVHCGSNVVRTPAENLSWWQDARHLLETP